MLIYLWTYYLKLKLKGSKAGKTFFRGRVHQVPRHYSYILNTWQIVGIKKKTITNDLVFTVNLIQ